MVYQLLPPWPFCIENVLQMLISKLKGCCTPFYATHNFKLHQLNPFQTISPNSTIFHPNHIFFPKFKPEYFSILHLLSNYVSIVLKLKFFRNTYKFKCNSRKNNNNKKYTANRFGEFSNATISLWFIRMLICIELKWIFSCSFSNANSSCPPKFKKKLLTLLDLEFDFVILDILEHQTNVC